MSDFADAGQSLTEARAHKNKDASAWTVRDMLVCALREIDRGEAIPKHAMLVLVNEEEDGKTVCDYYRVMPSTLYGLGILTRAIRELDG